MPDSKTRKSSDPLPPPERGDEHPESVFQRIGEALSRWEAIEEQIADTFSIITGGDTGFSISPAKRAYGTIATFRGRSEMLLGAAEVFFRTYPQADLHKRLKVLTKEVGAFAARRNEIAHGIVKQFSITMGDIPIEQDTTWYLMPPLYNSNKTNILETNPTLTHGERPAEEMVRDYVYRFMRAGYGTYKYNSEQIIYFVDRFKELADRADGLRAAVLAHREQAEARASRDRRR